MHFPSSINSKLPNTSTTIFTVMSALAREHNAINLSQGFPDYNPHPLVIEELTKAAKGNSNQYALMAGFMPLREQIAEKISLLYSAEVNPETEITVTAGGTQAIFTAILSVIREDDEVILFAPAYDSYAPAVELAGGKAIFYDREAPDYKIDWQHVKRLVNQRTRMIVINTPHNPTGTVMNAFDMQQLEKLTKDRDIVIVSDEVYEHIVYDGVQHQSILRYPKLAERAFVVFSFGKTYHCTGWKVGYCIAPQNLMSEFRKVHQFNVFSVNSVAQVAFAEVLKRKDLYEELNTFYQKKRDFFRSAIQSSRFKLLKCEGTYFQLAAYSRISEERDIEFVKRLTRDFKVAAIPISVFYRHQVDSSIIRFCFAKEEETLKRAAEMLVKI
ncbi:MAG: aminotransferase class I/II-fold pyridoxal phosphate-dependent enzyme [Chitinophagales bacterium]|nr:aminotransferase class I/II-fold pyridoxal phosphate-dependent enzyme [Chitinophagales bacterium]